MVTRWPEATATRFSSDQAMAFGKLGEPRSIAGCNGVEGGEAMLEPFLLKMRNQNLQKRRMRVRIPVIVDK